MQVVWLFGLCCYMFELYLTGYMFVGLLQFVSLCFDRLKVVRAGLYGLMYYAGLWRFELF